MSAFSHMEVVPARTLLLMTWRTRWVMDSVLNCIHTFAKRHRRQCSKMYGSSFLLEPEKLTKDVSRLSMPLQARCPDLILQPVFCVNSLGVKHGHKVVRVLSLQWQNENELKPANCKNGAYKLFPNVHDVVRTYVRTWIHVYIYVSMYLCIYMYLCVSVCICVYLSVYVSMCIYVSAYLRIYVSVCICTYVDMYLCKCVCNYNETCIEYTRIHSARYLKYARLYLLSLQSVAWHLSTILKAKLKKPALRQRQQYHHWKGWWWHSPLGCVVQARMNKHWG